MNLEHLKAIMWLRWRMSRNQWRRAGKFNAAITTAFVVLMFVASVLLFFAALIGGSTVLLMNEITPDVLMLTWDGIIVVFLAVWTIGLITELQKSELLSLERLLHLPLSLSGTFFLNYASSLLSLPIVVFLPGMLGLAIACVIANGVSMLTIFPLLASFILFVTALTYQFRGWLAMLMENKRRRKSIIVGLTVVFVLMMQTPQLLNFAFMGNKDRSDSREAKEYQEGVEALTRQLQAGEITVEENTQQMKALEELREQRRTEAKGQRYQTVVDYVLLGNKVVPLGWFPYGVRAAAMGNAVPGLLASAAMFGVGGLSLRRSYAATLRFYTGTGSAPKRKAAKTIAITRHAANSLEQRFPFLSEHTTAVALASFRSLLRAPESKMALMVPVILVFVFGGMMILGPGHSLRREDIGVVPPFLGIGIIGVILFGLAQLMFNVFGSDRGAFRACVLLPVSRRDVLLGKNLAVAPIAGCICVVLTVVLQVVMGMRVTHLLATFVQFVPSYLMFCLIGNVSSIVAPLAVASGSLKPAHPKISTMLYQMFFFMFTPIVVLPAVVTLGIETALAHMTRVSWLPIYLVCSLMEAGVVVWMYGKLLKLQGDWLQKRESRILEILAEVPE
ncbi:MAG TPA: hypothetical protein P5307_14540 [Pirellulaceae bacterium]|nr:hypothetical protein [Pirellulaceae bacterium]